MRLCGTCLLDLAHAKDLGRYGGRQPLKHVALRPQRVDRVHLPNRGAEGGGSLITLLQDMPVEHSADWATLIPSSPHLPPPPNLARGDGHVCVARLGLSHGHHLQVGAGQQARPGERRESECARFG